MPKSLLMPAPADVVSASLLVAIVTSDVLPLAAVDSDDLNIVSTATKQNVE